MPQTTTIYLPKPHPAQQKVLSEAKRINILCCGRRWGKTKLATALLIKPALAGYPVAYASPTHKMLTEVWREIRQTLQPIATRIDSQQHRIELPTGGVIDMWSLEAFESIRGRKYKRFIPDEAAMVPNLAEAWQAAIRPTLTDLRGDAWLLSTPRGHNFFWEAWQRGQDPTYPDWASWQMPTSSNPYIHPDEIEIARRELPERTFAQEYLATFLESGGGVFRNVIARSVATPQEPQAGRQYVIGADFARSVDYSVYSVWDVAARQEVCLDRSNQISYELQAKRLAALAARYNNALVIPESNSIGTPVIEQLQSLDVQVQPFTTTNATKQVIVDGMVLALEQSTATLLNDAVATAEMQAFEMERLPSGLYRYSAPENTHDDIVISRCLGLYGITNSNVGFSYAYHTPAKRR